MDDKPVLDATQPDPIIAEEFGDTGPQITVIEAMERLERIRVRRAEAQKRMREKERRRERRKQLERIGRRRRKKIAR